MRFRGDDDLLAMDVLDSDAAVVTVTDGGYAKRTPASEWNVKGRGILGVRAMRLVSERGNPVGALVCNSADEIYAIASNGVVIRTEVSQIRETGRDTMGVALMDLGEGEAVVAVARSAELTDPIDSAAPDDVVDVESADVDGAHETPEHSGDDTADEPGQGGNE